MLFCLYVVGNHYIAQVGYTADILLLLMSTFFHGQLRYSQFVCSDIVAGGKHVRKYVFMIV